MLRTLILMSVIGGMSANACAEDIPIGFYRFGVPAGFRESRPGAISGDGNRVIGVAYASTPNTPASAFEWTYSAGVSITPVPSTMQLLAWTGLSFDGQVAAGWAYENGGGRYAAVSWPAGGQPEILGHYSGFRDTIPLDVSQDGRVIYGYSSTQFGGTSVGVPVRWTQETGFVSMGSVPGGITRGQAIATNADGSVAVGYASDVSIGSQVAFRWTEAAGYTVYPSMLQLTAISADGRWMGEFSMMATLFGSTRVASNSGLIRAEQSAVCHEV
jgi:uncharacterized membrane protein